MASGVGVSNACVSQYQDLKLGKTKTHKYIIFNLNKAMTEIVVEDRKADNESVVGEKSEEEGAEVVDKKELWKTEYDEFVSRELPEGECRWAVYDYEFEKEGGIRKKLVFVAWAPTEAKIKQKMLFASSKEALRRSLDGIGFEVQASDHADVCYDAVLEKAKLFR